MIVKNLSKSFNSNKILDNISFVLEDNDKVCLIGNNGAGKSTLLKILNGNINYDSGNINYNDESIGMLMQEIGIKDYDLTITCYIKRKTGLFSFTHISFISLLIILYGLSIVHSTKSELRTSFTISSSF